ncbi:MAG: hypothetical protein J3K34DRAFT_437785 [Monoraphidium minutum]|nr:MAG: hypothetical protein J3K34DRAFT_437785 [Monoraphidium minutum]
MALAQGALLALALLAAAARHAHAQPCIECKDCVTNNCWRVCRDSCAPVRPSDIIVSGDDCKRAGDALGPAASQSACDTTKKYCNGGKRAPMKATRGAIGAVTLSQCSNVALGSCQQTANNAYNWRHPCGRELRSGYSQCSAADFQAFFKGETKDLCTTLAKDVTGVTPGTNQWADDYQDDYGYGSSGSRGGGAGSKGPSGAAGSVPLRPSGQQGGGGPTVLPPRTGGNGGYGGTGAGQQQPPRTGGTGGYGGTGGSGAAQQQPPRTGTAQSPQTAPARPGLAALGNLLTRAAGGQPAGGQPAGGLFGLGGMGRKL